MAKEKLSLFADIKSKHNETVELDVVLNHIKSGKWASEIMRLREFYVLNETVQYRELKALLPAATFMGIFDGSHLMKNMLKYNQLVLLDIDHVKEGDVGSMVELRKIVDSDPHTFVSFISPSGDGLKILVKVSSSVDDHKLAYKQVVQYYGSIGVKGIDSSGSNANRLCYISYDPALYSNFNAEVFKVKKVSKKEKKKTAVEMKKVNSAEYREAVAILEFLSVNDRSITTKHKDWYQVAYALVDTFGPDALELYLTFCRLDGEKHDEKASINQWVYCVANNKGETSFAFIVNKAKRLGYQSKQFWFEGSDGNVGIDQNRLINFLRSEGYLLMKMPGSKAYVFLKNTNNIVEEVTSEDIKQFIIEHVRNLPYELGSITRDDVMNKLIRGRSTYLSGEEFRMVGAGEFTFHKDTRFSTYFYFKNGFVEVTGEYVCFNPYSKLQGYIWRGQVIDHEITLDLNGGVKGEFHQFITNICNNDERIASLKTAIGYLLSRFKDPAETKAVIFIDEKIGEVGEANGGTGKSLICEAFRYLRKVLYKDGKRREDARFMHQDITLETDIVCYDDIRENFDFESLYAAITSDMTVEQKGRSPFSLPKEETPKFLISSNYVLGGPQGRSSDRRKFVIEFSDHYTGEGNLPVDEFGHRLYSEWEKEEWNKFFNCLFHCAQLYLSVGLKLYTPINLAQNEYMAKVPAEFNDFIVGCKFVLGEDYELKTLLNKFSSHNEHLNRVTQKTFNKWVTKYVIYKGWVTYASKAKLTNSKYFHLSEGKQCIRFVEMD